MSRRGDEAYGYTTVNQTCCCDKSVANVAALVGSRLANEIDCSSDQEGLSKVESNETQTWEDTR